jgi:hypothetical protein
VPLETDIRAFSPPASRRTDGTNRYMSNKVKRVASTQPNTTEKANDYTTAEGSETLAITSAIHDGVKTPLQLMSSLGPPKTAVGRTRHRMSNTPMKDNKSQGRTKIRVN